MQAIKNVVALLGSVLVIATACAVATAPIWVTVAAIKYAIS